MAYGATIIQIGVIAMLCMTCKYGNGEGYCGLGRQVVDSKCSGYTGGIQAKPLPHPMVSIMRGDMAPLGDIPFPVRGRYDAPNSIRYWVMRPSRYELLILPGERGYDTLTEHIQGHTYQLEWGPCRYTINTSPTIGHPIVIVVSFSHMSRWAEKGYSPRVGDYLWWLDPSANSWAVGMFLEGLVMLYKMHYQFTQGGAYYKPYSMKTPLPVPLRLLQGIGHPFIEPLSSVALIYAYHEGAHMYLVDQYMKANIELDTTSGRVAMAFLQYWEDVLDSYYTYLQ